MAAFSDPEVMAALQDGMFLVSHTNLAMLVYFQFWLPICCGIFFVNSGAVLQRFLLVIWFP
jgi:hypothetical protein